MKEILLPLVVASLMGVAAIFEKLSLQGASPLGVFTIRSAVMSALLVAISLTVRNYREYATYKPLTYLWIVIPALLTIVSVWVYFVALKDGMVSRIFPIIATAPAFALLFSVVFLDEPLTWSRILGILLIIGGIMLVK